LDKESERIIGVGSISIDAPKAGLKWDEGKLDWHALPLVILKPLVEVFEAGICKGYGRFNCLNTFDNPDERFFSATMRHLEACQIDPLAKDEETGCYNAAQVAFSILMRLYHCQKEQLWKNEKREQDK
jgi:hypothetical protein